MLIRLGLALGSALLMQGAIAPLLAHPIPGTVASAEQFAHHHLNIGLRNVPIAHQGDHKLNIQLEYVDFEASEIAAPSPDILQRFISNFLEDYPNEEDFWEIVNRNLTAALLTQYPHIEPLSLEIGVMPCDRFPHWRGSIVTHEFGQLREFWYFSMALSEQLESPLPFAETDLDRGLLPNSTLRIAYEYRAPEGKAMVYPDYYAVMDSVLAVWDGAFGPPTAAAIAAIVAQIQNDHRTITGVDLRLNNTLAIQGEL